MISPVQAFQQADFRGQLRQMVWNEIGLLSKLGMEIAWLLPWVQTNIQGAQRAKSLHIFILLALFAVLVMVVSRLLKFRLANPVLNQLVLFGILFGASLWFLNLSIYAGLGLSPRLILIQTLASFSQAAGGIPSTVTLLLMTMFAWWRGIAIANKSALDYFSVRSRFRWGIAGLALFGLLNSSHNNRYLLEAIPIFFISGLLAIALSRTHRLGQSRAAFHLPFTESWFVGIVFLTLGTLILGMLGGELLRTSLALEIAKIVGDLVIRGIQVLILVISPLFVWIPALADMLNELLSSPEQIAPEPVDPDAELGQAEFEFDFGQTPPILEIPPALVIIMVVLVLILLAGLIVRSARKRRRSQFPDFGDPGESIYKSQNLGTRLRNLLGQAKMGIDYALRFGLGRRILDATAIRWTYYQMLDFAARMGRERKPHETPIEFQEHLHKLFPVHQEEIVLITGAFTKIRYGEFPEEEDIVALVRSAWLRMRSDAIGRPN